MAGIKEVAETQIGDTITTDDRPAQEPLPGFQTDEADGLQRALSDRLGAVPGFARSVGKTAAERFVVYLRAGDLAGVGLRFSLRLSRPAAHGHRARAARARVRLESDHHGGNGGLPRDHDHG